MSSLKRAKIWLADLIAYLYQKGIKADKLTRITLQHSKALDKRNADDPRAFCQVACDSNTIQCSLAIDQLHETFIVGILLHELAHVIVGCGRKPDDEVAVDEWIIKNVPEAEYKYANHVYSSKPNSFERRTAQNLEVVSHKFTNRIWTSGK